jgi:hypothetical protein
MEYANYAVKNILGAEKLILNIVVMLARQKHIAIKIRKITVITVNVAGVAVVQLFMIKKNILNSAKSALSERNWFAQYVVINFYQEIP